jgi:hypothetical protein
MLAFFSSLSRRRSGSISAIDTGLRRYDGQEFQVFEQLIDDTSCVSSCFPPPFGAASTMLSRGGAFVKIGG